MTIARRLLAATALLTALLPPGGKPASAQNNAPPHAWLFGEWTGGLFPVPSSMTAQMCAANPVVIFTRDVVLRATLTDITYAQREIETVRATPQGAEFRFRPGAGQTASANMLGLSGPGAAVGFGCNDPDSLHVQRRTDNEITFPGCSEFPEPLIRCPAR
jgi:hypothetical protein